MKYQFHWKSIISGNTKNSAEEAIRSSQESGHSPITFCHDGIVNVTISVPDPLQMMLIGNMKCSCGKPRGVVSGRIDGSSMAFDLAKGY